MKTRKNIITILTLSAALSLTACSGKEATEESKKPSTSTTADAKESKDTKESKDASTKKLDDLYQQENQIFADHSEVWDKVFGMMSKTNADSDSAYADFLTATIEENKSSFTEDELKTLESDIETIRGIEEQISKLEDELATTGSADTEDAADEDTPFKDLSGTDFDGNKVDGTLFSNNAVTVLNFWFTGCKPCVAELSKLNEMNEAIKSMGGEVVGINTETFDSNESAIKDAKKVLESQGATYRNLSIASDSNAGKYASEIMAFPTTILVDRNGKIVGDPMLGGIDDPDNYDTLMSQIQSVIDADSANK